jgi:hypothetical protein
METPGQVASDQQPVAGHERNGVPQLYELVVAAHLYQVRRAVGSVESTDVEGCGHRRRDLSDRRSIRRWKIALWTQGTPSE